MGSGNYCRLTHILAPATPRWYGLLLKTPPIATGARGGFDDPLFYSRLLSASIRKHGDIFCRLGWEILLS